MTKIAPQVNLSRYSSYSTDKSSKKDKMGFKKQTAQKGLTNNVLLKNHVFWYVNF